MSRLILIHSCAQDEFGEPIDTRVVELGDGISIESAIFECERSAWRPKFNGGYYVNKDYFIYFIAEIERNEERTIHYPFYNYINLENAKEKYKELKALNNTDVYLFKGIYDGNEELDVPMDEEYMRKHALMIFKAGQTHS